MNILPDATRQQLPTIELNPDTVYTNAWLATRDTCTVDITTAREIARYFSSLHTAFATFALRGVVTEELGQAFHSAYAVADERQNTMLLALEEFVICALIECYVLENKLTGTITRTADIDTACATFNELTEHCTDDATLYAVDNTYQLLEEEYAIITPTVEVRRDRCDGALFIYG